MVNAVYCGLNICGEVLWMSIPTFVGRTTELRLLQSLAEAPRPSIAVVYGRRRIGKSLLIQTAFAGRRTLQFEGLEDRPLQEQIANFLEQLRSQSAVSRDQCNGVHSWREAFRLLGTAIRGQQVVICLDEFQWMANYRHEIVSDLTLVWDQQLGKEPGVRLVLCGSIASFMINKVIKGRALYGRVDAQIHLKAFMLGETNALMAGRGLHEVLEAHLYTGGVPKYLALIAERNSVRLAIEELAFSPAGYLFAEYDRIFISHFGRNPEFARIIERLSSHPYGLTPTQIAKTVKASTGGLLTNHLFDLASAGFIQAVTPFDKGDNARLVKYVLSDAYLRFYFAFIKPNHKLIQDGAASDLFARATQTGAFDAWMGHAFEFLVTQHAVRIAELLGFSGVNYRFGPYFRSPRKQTAGVQVDLLFERADNVITLCEMKYSTASSIGSDIIPQVERKAQLLSGLFPRKTIQKVLVSNVEPSAEVRTAGYFYRCINADELFGPRGSLG
jgi:uncharacterized protein